MIYLLGALGAALLGFALVGRRSTDSATVSSARADDGGLAADVPASLADPGLRGPRGSRAGTLASDGSPAAATPLATEPLGGHAAPPTMTQWAAALADGCLRAQILLAYALRWVTIESAGQPCACGVPDARGPDGYPKEMGIAQLYNPDDLSVVGPPLTGAELRAYCVPGDWHPILYKGKIIKGFSQDQFRPLTSVEIQRQADATVGLIARCDQLVSARLAAAGASGPGWARTRRGYWALVKLQHGEPVLASAALPAVRAVLGRAPRDWQEFAACLPRVRPRYAEVIPVVLRNAEKCASAVPEDVRGVA